MAEPTDDWGTPEHARAAADEAFRRRSPLDRLAWLEELWTLRGLARKPLPGDVARKS